MGTYIIMKKVVLVKRRRRSTATRSSSACDFMLTKLSVLGLEEHNEREPDDPELEETPPFQVLVE